MQRQPKHLLDPLLKDLNQDRVVVLRPKQWSGRSGETLEVLIRTMDIAGQQKEGRVAWQAGARTGELPAPGGSISLVLDRPGVVTLYAKWLAKDGTQLALNQVNLACVSAEAVPARLRVRGNPALASVLSELGYQVSEGNAASISADEIVVASSYTSELETYVHDGGQVLLLADPSLSEAAGKTVALPVGHVVPRAGSVWQGDWANSIAWIRKQGPLAHLLGGSLLEMEWAHLMPTTRSKMVYPSCASSRLPGTRRVGLPCPAKHRDRNMLRN